MFLNKCVTNFLLILYFIHLTFLASFHEGGFLVLLFSLMYHHITYKTTTATVSFKNTFYKIQH